MAHSSYRCEVCKAALAANDGRMPLVRAVGPWRSSGRDRNRDFTETFPCGYVCRGTEYPNLLGEFFPASGFKKAKRIK